MQSSSTPQPISNEQLKTSELEYKIALYKAAKIAANNVESFLNPDKKSHENMEKQQFEYSLQLLAIVEGVSQSKE